MKTLLVTIILVLMTSKFIKAEITVQIISVSGDVSVRYGLDEKWQPAAAGMILKDIDTILSGENAEVILKTGEQKTFMLGSNAILDIADLRKVQEKELFLYLMSKKVDQIEPPDKKTRLRVGNVSVVHGSLNKTGDSSAVDTGRSKWAILEKNGALALQMQKYYTNSIIKLHKIIEKYEAQINKGEIYFYIAKGFEAINKDGQAIDAYKKSINYYESSEDDNSKKKIVEIRKQINKLKN